MVHKQTAVEWLHDRLKKRPYLQLTDLEFEQAKQMEKEQIISAFIVAENNEWDGIRHGVHYYQQTYGKGNQSI